MESQHQNPELRIHPENFHPCTSAISSKATCDGTYCNRTSENDTLFAGVINGKIDNGMIKRDLPTGQRTTAQKRSSETVPFPLACVVKYSQNIMTQPRDH